MLSFQYLPEREAIQIHADEAGLATLIDALERVREIGHLHLWAPSLGGTALSDLSPFGEPAIAEVSITTGGD